MSQPDQRALLGAVAAHGLAGAPAPGPVGPLDADDWDRLVAGARSHRLVGLLVAAAADGTIALDAPQRDELDEVERGVAVHVVQVERLLLDLSTAFERDGIDLLVLKGPAVAHTAYGRPELRTFSDVDVVVRSAHLEAALAALAGLGVHRKLPALRPGFDRRFAKSITCAGTDGLEVDLHRALAAGPLATTLADGALFEVADEFTLAGRTLRCLDLHATFVHACAHLVLGGTEVLMNARDVAQLVEADGFEPATAADRARGWQLSAVVAAALEVVRVGLALPDSWGAAVGDRLVPTAGERALLETYPRGVGQDDQLARRTLAQLPGLRAKASYAAAYAWPTAAHLRARDLTRRSHLRRLAGRGR